MEISCALWLQHVKIFSSSISLLGRGLGTSQSQGRHEGLCPHCHEVCIPLGIDRGHIRVSDGGSGTAAKDIWEQRVAIGQPQMVE
jgi:hypothetical protein